jgi:hypothetical protein
MGDGQYKSALAKAIEQRERKLHVFEVNNFFGLGDKPILRIAIRVPTKAEEDKAVVQAHAYVNTKATGDSESARTDHDLLNDAKVAAVLHSACFVPPEEGSASRVLYQAFPGGQWMRDNLTADQLGVLFHHLLEVKRADSPLATAIDYDTTEALARACWMAADSDIPEAMLSKCDRDYLTQSFVLLSVKLAEALGWTKDGSAADSEAELATAERGEEDGISDDS